MTTANIGIRSGNVIVPYVSTTKRTKELNISSGVTSNPAASTVEVSAIFYADSAGKWRMNFTGQVEYAAQADLSGDGTAYLTFATGSNFATTPSAQGVVMDALNDALANQVVVCQSAASSNRLSFYGSSTTIRYLRFSGDVLLVGEPTTYTTAANMEGVIVADVYIPPASGATPGIVDNLAQHFHGVKDFGDGIKLNTGDALSTYVVNTWTPIVTLVGGSGNTVPVYTTNLGRYTRIGNRVFCEIILSGDGGAEGAGTGTVAISLPFGAVSSGVNYWGLGYVYNSTTELQPLPVISAGASIVAINYWNAGSIISLTGAGQNNASRGIQISIVYEAV
jgi:hypothetical protein